MKSIRKKIFAWVLSRSFKERTLGPLRASLLQSIEGRVVEFGAGTGINFKYYPQGAEVVAIEPNPYMHAYLKAEAKRRGIGLTILGLRGESTDLPDGSADTVVSTLVLCSVNDVRAVIGEAYRVLRTGGQFLFLEHVRSRKRCCALLQRAFTPMSKFLFDGCHADRDTLSCINQSGFSEIQYKESEIMMPFHVPLIYGRAIK